MSPGPTPRVTVVVPAFNRQHTLARCLLSVTHQTMRDLEVIVVDDASRDGTAEIASSFPDERVRLIRLPSNRGGGVARNTGIEAARAPLVALLDSDDSWLPQKLTENLRFAEGLGGGGERWVIFNRLLIDDEHGQRLSAVLPDGPLGSVAEHLFVRRRLIQTSSVVLPTSLARDVPFDPTLKRLQDWDWYLRLERKGSTFYGQNQALTVHAAAPSPDRISSAVDTTMLRQWVEQRSPWLTQRQLVGFLANKVAPEEVLAGNRLKGMRLLLRGLAHGVLPVENLPVDLARALLPASAFNLVRKHYRRLRSSNS